MEKKTRKIDEDLIQFIAESRDILAEIEPKLIGLGDILEKNGPPDEETVNMIFRGFHTIKGTAAFYQLEGVVAVTHKSETLLEYFRKGKETISASSTDILCHACDVVETLFQQLETTGFENLEEDHVGSIVHRLNGRIDLFKQKHMERGLQPDSLEPPYTEPEDVATGDQRGQAITAGRKIGKTTRIFLDECRDMMSRLDAMNVNEPLEDDILGQGREILNTLAEGAFFLGFDRMSSSANQCLDIINQSNMADRHLEDDDREQIGKLISTIHRMVDRIETSATDELDPQEAPESLPPQNRHNSVINDHDPVAPVSPALTEGTAAVCDSLRDLFYQDVDDNVGQLKSLLTHLKRERLNHRILDDIKQRFHQIKGCSGIANQGDLEWIATSAEECVDDALDDLIVFDEWDINALFHVVSEIENTLVRLKQGHSGNPFKKVSLAHIMEQVRAGKTREEKEKAIEIPDVEGATYQKNADRPDGVSSNEGDESFSFPLPHPEDTLTEQTAGSSDKNDAGPPWVGEKRKTERRDIRVNIEKLDELINLVGELVIAENMVVRNPDILNLELVNFEKAGAHLRKIVRDLQDVALAVRMVPISGVFRRMVRLVHDLSVKSGKKVSLKLVGEDTEIDKTVAELISDPLVHLVRNAIDHGIEKISDRENGTEDGCIILEARHEGGAVLVIIRDNGKGLDVEKILGKAKRAGIVDDSTDSLSRSEIQNLIFHPGFSTQDNVTDLSGRGVGMDVVKKNMEKVNGRIQVYSRPDMGTSFVLRIPLTLAIIDGMLVRVGDTSYTIPLLSIKETVQVDEEQVILTMDGQETVNMRGELIPIVRLHDMYHLEPRFTRLNEGLVIIVEHQYDRAGLFIDTIIGEQQTVIKGMSGYMGTIPGVSGCTILGDGEVSLILDVAGIIQKAKDIGIRTYIAAAGE